VGEQVRLVDRDDDVPVFLICLGGQGGLDLGDEGGVVEAGRLAERGGHRAVQAAHPDLGVGQVDQGVPGGVQAVGGGAQGDRLPRADLPRYHPEAAGGDQPAQPGDGLLVGSRAEQGGHGDGRAERHEGEAIVGLQVLDHRGSFRGISRWRR